MGASALAPAWQPRVPLTAAEQRVDFPAHNEHIYQRRLALERHALPAANRLALIVAEYSLPTPQVQAELEGRLFSSLARSIDFGYEQARRELRGQRPVVRASLRIPGIGSRGRVVLSGLEGIHALARQRAALVARDVADQARAAARKAAEKASLAPQAASLSRRLAVADAVRRTLHNDVLQLVTESLNLGRAAGAMSMPHPPEYAMRSEQLDENTCDECDALHGEIVQIGTAEFFDSMPPEGCAGGGRCRGLYVYGD